MRRPTPMRYLLLLALLPISPLRAVQLESVQVQGIGEPLSDNARAKISLAQLSPQQRAALSETRLAFLLRAVPREVREGLEPFGYYDAQVETRLVREAGRVSVIVQVEPGLPVLVRELDVTVAGPGGSDPEVQTRVSDFLPQPGDPLDHREYEDSKANIGRALAQRGYFDANLGVHRVEVTRAEKAADIALAWDSGRRYRLGPVHFDGDQFRAGVLDPLVPWEPGQAYQQELLLQLQQSLADTDYFTGISLLPEPEQATDGLVPVRVTLVPNKRSLYNLGLRYGTDSGAGINARLERRWINDRGHKLLAELNLAQFLSDATVQYRVPGFGWLDGWYALTASAREEEIDEVRSQYVNVAATRTGHWRDWELMAGLNFKRERFDAFDTQRVDYITLVYPSLLGVWSRADDPIWPSRGVGLTLELRGGASALGSQVDFLQLRAQGRYIRSLSGANRLLLRGELGTTLTDQFDDFPPSMRWYAGGDKSVRGYGYKEIGQRVDDRVIGGKHLVVASVEFEHMFTPVWGAAVFVDAGDAFDDSPDMKLGIGAGLRWRSPIGPVRVDIAHGLDNADQAARLHVSIGPEL